jgi:Tol biopolymer transport system component
MRGLTRIVVAISLAGPLLAVPAGPAHAAFPGANGLIAWSKVFLRTDAEIFVMDPDGGNQVQLSHNDRTDFDPAWSADGTQLVFSSSTATDADIWVMNADGTGEHNVSNDPGVPDIQPAWSPDGTQIAFVEQRPIDGTSAVWVMDADGSNQQQLTDLRTVNLHPNWSPDGSRIAFATNRDGNLELYTIEPDGTDLTRLTNTPGQQEDNPNWSPDGGRLVYDACVATSYPCPGSPNFDIFAMRADGSARRRLTDDPSIDANAAWSPDGREIVFRSDRSPDGTELWKMNADGSGEVELTFDPFQGGVDPDWQPLP